MTNPPSFLGSRSVVTQVAVFAVAALCASAAQAQVVMFQFTSNAANTFEDPGGHLAALGIGMGTPIVGYVSYDVAQSAPDQLPADSTASRFSFAAGAYSLSFNIAGHTFASNPAEAAHQILVFNSAAGGDVLQYSWWDGLRDGGALPGAPAYSSGLLELNDQSGTALANDSLPTAAPDLSKFQKFQLISLAAYAADDSVLWYIGGTVNSITVVPEPAEMAGAVGLGLAAFAIGRKSRRFGR